MLPANTGEAHSPTARAAFAVAPSVALPPAAIVWLKAYFKDPKSKIPDSKMPKMTLSDEDWDAVTKYLLTLKGAAK